MSLASEKVLTEEISPKILFPEITSSWISFPVDLPLTILPVVVSMPKSRRILFPPGKRPGEKLPRQTR